MDFVKYSSIENSYRTKTINEIKENGLNGEDFEWVVTEKVHGSNISFWMNPEGIKPAKRTSFLIPEDGKFFNYDSVMEIYMENFRTLYLMAKDMTDDLVEQGKLEVNEETSVVLYGEIFGGYYDHLEVEKVADALKVQKGVQYCPHNDFYAFDLKINGHFLNYDLFREFMEATGFLYAKELHRGNFESCLSYPNEFQTTIPSMFGLPEIKDNVCEGIVIKPVYTSYFPNGSRVILKNKNEKFKEVSKKRKHNKKPKKKEDNTLNEEQEKIFENIQEYITENRLKNVISHIGEINNKMFGKLTGLFTKDVMDDFCKDNNSLEVIDKEDRKKIQKNVSNSCADLVRKNFCNIVDNTF
jgi:Rnl2 family RNA ligase